MDSSTTWCSDGETSRLSSWQVHDIFPPVKIWHMQDFNLFCASYLFGSKFGWDIFLHFRNLFPIYIHIYLFVLSLVEKVNDKVLVETNLDHLSQIPVPYQAVSPQSPDLGQNDTLDITLLQDLQFALFSRMLKYACFQCKSSSLFSLDTSFGRFVLDLHFYEVVRSNSVLFTILPPSIFGLVNKTTLCAVHCGWSDLGQ